MNKNIISSDRSYVEPWLSACNRITSPPVLDILDANNLRHQAIKLGPTARIAQKVVVGTAKTLLWANLAHHDPTNYESVLKAVDSLRPGEVVICATSNSSKSGIWGELLTTAAVERGAVGIVTDGAVRDIGQIEAMGFAVFSRSISPNDCLGRQKVMDFDICVEIDGVMIEPEDIIVADRNGVAVVPKQLSDEVLTDALKKADREDQFRYAVRNGMGAFEAYEKFQVL